MPQAQAPAPEIITEYPSQGITLDEAGIKASRTFSVLAKSAFEAMTLLRINRRVSQFSMYESPQGEVPDKSIICTSLNVKAQKKEAPPGGTALYEVTANYGRVTSQAVPDGPPIYRIRGTTTTAPVDHDAWGNPILTSSDEPIDPPLTMLQPDERLVVEWWVADQDQLRLQMDMRRFRGALNSTTWKGAPRGCLMCQGVEISDVQTNKIKLSTEMIFKPPVEIADLNATVMVRGKSNTLQAVGRQLEGWYGTYVDRGTRTKTTPRDGPPQYTPIRKGGEAVDKPINLDGQGAEAQPNAKPVLIGVAIQANYQNFAEMGI